MRQRFEQQLNLRTIAVSDVKLHMKSQKSIPFLKNTPNG